MKEEDLIRDFKHLKNSFLKQLKGRVHKVTEICALTGIPLLVGWTFVKEKFPEHLEKANIEIEKIRRFYGYRS